MFTGGGTAGHILPNIAVIEAIRERERADMLYVGSHTGPERELCAQYDVPFTSISTGKLRRYLSLKNLIDPFKVIKGALDAWRVVGRFRPDVVFSKGGFVSVPVVLAAAMRGVPVVLHEADVTPGLANRICARFAKIICVSFPETVAAFSRLGGGAREGVLLTGMPVRTEILRGSAEKGRVFLGLDRGGDARDGGDVRSVRPVLLVVGGSLGATSLNRLLWQQLDALVKVFDVVHVTGMREDRRACQALEKKYPTAYRSFPYIHGELADVYAASDVVVSRAGSGAIAELAALQKPMVLVPLGRRQSRGDQMVNARLFASAGAAEVFCEDCDAPRDFVRLVVGLGRDKTKRARLAKHLHPFGQRCRRAAGQIAEVITGTA